MRIGIDLLGSDTPPARLFPAILRIGRESPPNTSFVVFTTKEVKEEFCFQHLPTHLTYHEVDEFITMEDNPARSVRQKKNSSLVVAMHMLKKKEINALVSTGNTGALITAAATIMPKSPGIKRPGLLAVLPTLQGPLTVVDVGGNVSCKAINLVQFAQLAATHHCHTCHQPKARVGLLNIGVESSKGTSELRLAYHLLKKSSEENLMPQIIFVGNVEARDIFNGSIDVLATDGFTGNVLIKASEGVSSFIFDYMKAHAPSMQSLNSSIDHLQAVFHPAEHPGAIICGIDGLVIKCHGNATEASLYSAIKAAILKSEER